VGTGAPLVLGGAVGSDEQQALAKMTMRAPRITQLIFRSQRNASTLFLSMATESESAPKPLYDCLKCPAYCCSYDRISVNKRDLNRLARHFGIDAETAEKRFTKTVEGEQVLRHQKDQFFGSICMFMDTKARRCTVYNARPGVCHEYPDRPRCGYYDFLRWERSHQEDPEFVPMRRY
jgi:Fe-S-cluster containining protein